MEFILSDKNRLLTGENIRSRHSNVPVLTEMSAKEIASGSKTFAPVFL